VQRAQVMLPLKVVESRNACIGVLADGLFGLAGNSVSCALASARSHPGIEDRVEPYNESAW
jgi:hypothetical protein